MNEDNKNPFSSNSLEGIDHEISTLDSNRDKILDQKYHQQRTDLINRKASLLKQAGQLRGVDADGYVNESPATRTIDSIHSALPTKMSEIDRQIEIHKSQNVIDYDRLEKLYSRKAQFMKERGLLQEVNDDAYTNQVVSVQTSKIPVDRQINLAAVESEIERERSKDYIDTDRLGQLYDQKASFLKANGELDETNVDGGYAAAGAQSPTDGVTASLQDHWGAEYDLNSYELYHNVRSVFGGDDFRMQEIIGQLPQHEQVALAGEVTKFTAHPISEKHSSAESCVQVVQTTLRDMWGNNYDATLAECQRVAEAVWGSLTNFDDWCSRTNISRNSDSQVQLMKILTRMARSIK